MVREVPGYLIVKMLQADKLPRKPRKRHPRFVEAVIHLYRALFD